MRGCGSRALRRRSASCERQQSAGVCVCERVGAAPASCERWSSGPCRARAGVAAMAHGVAAPSMLRFALCIAYMFV
eukprot:scaffold6876_cov109-Isochrysis_galbana.AAC.5